LNDASMHFADNAVVEKTTKSSIWNWEWI